MEEFRNLTKSQQSNIKSNWIAIIGCILEHNKLPNYHFNKYGITHLVRQIDSYYTFPISIKLKETLNRIGYTKNYLKQSDRPSINRLLKTHRINDTIQIEHFNGGVKKLIEKLIEEIRNSTSSLEENINKCMMIHKNHTTCCYKLVKEEMDLNADTKESDYLTRIYLSY
jgi:hypothetical protein